MSCVAPQKIQYVNPQTGLGANTSIRITTRRSARTSPRKFVIRYVRVNFISDLVIGILFSISTLDELCQNILPL